MQNNKKDQRIFSDSRFLIYIYKSLMPITLVETIYIKM